MMFLWVILLAVLAVLFARSAGEGVGTPKQGPTSDRSLDILRERYARGEITRSEYEEMRRDLEG